MPSFNADAYIAGAIESVLAQTFKDHELIIVDDGSNDDTRRVVESYAQGYPQQVIYIHQENKGCAGARNTGVRAAKGEYIAILDADDQWLPERLAEGLKVIEADPRIGLVHAKSMRISNEGKELGVVKRDVKLLSEHDDNMFERIFLRQVNISCPTVLLRKKCFDELGLFDENLSRLGCEDREMWLRVAQRCRVVYIDQVLAFYRLSNTSMSKASEKMFKAHTYVIEKFAQQGAAKALKDKAYAVVYRNRGDESLLIGDFERSKESYLKAIQHDKWAIWPWVNLVKSILKIGAKHV